MPDGDLLTADYTFQIGTSAASDVIEQVYGGGSNGVYLDLKGPDGFLGWEAKTQDVPLFGRDGAYANPDYLAVHSMSIPVILKNAASEADLVNNLKALFDNWFPLAADIDLVFQWPGIGKIKWVGRPRGMTVDLSLQRRGAIRCLLRFDTVSTVIATVL